VKKARHDALDPPTIADASFCLLGQVFRTSFSSLLPACLPSSNQPPGS
jgi:hypothetical protein